MAGGKVIRLRGSDVVVLMKWLGWCSEGLVGKYWGGGDVGVGGMVRDGVVSLGEKLGAGVVGVGMGRGVYDLRLLRWEVRVLEELLLWIGRELLGSERLEYGSMDWILFDYLYRDLIKDR